MYVSDSVIIKTNLEIDLSQTINDQRYFGIKGKETFKTTIEIKDNVSSLSLESDLTNTEFNSEIDEISKNINDKLFTTIKIRNLSNPSYLIKNRKFEAFLIIKIMDILTLEMVLAKKLFHQNKSLMVFTFI